MDWITEKAITEPKPRYFKNRYRYRYLKNRKIPKTEQKNDVSALFDRRPMTISSDENAVLKVDKERWGGGYGLANL
jgi:hypothetical protein